MRELFESFPLDEGVTLLEQRARAGHRSWALSCTVARARLLRRRCDAWAKANGWRPLNPPLAGQGAWSLSYVRAAGADGAVGQSLVLQCSWFAAKIATLRVFVDLPDELEPISESIDAFGVRVPLPLLVEPARISREGRSVEVSFATADSVANVFDLYRAWAVRAGLSLRDEGDAGDVDEWRFEGDGLRIEISCAGSLDGTTTGMVTVTSSALR